VLLLDAVREMIDVIGDIGARDNGKPSVPILGVNAFKAFKRSVSGSGT
jgi:hypothetical protein